jgi:uncharacterized protein (DUF2147 family)
MVGCQNFGKRAVRRLGEDPSSNLVAQLIHRRLQIVFQEVGGAAMRGSVITAGFLVLAAGAVRASEAGIEGKWIRDDGNALVLIAPCGAHICATNLWIGDTSTGEEVGDRLVMSLEASSDRSFTGVAYDPKRNLRYSIVVTRQKEGLVTRGCFVGKLLCKDVSWTPER